MQKARWIKESNSKTRCLPAASELVATFEFAVHGACKQIYAQYSLSLLCGCVVHAVCSSKKGCGVRKGMLL
jgi:hypothetical protein